MREEIIKYAVEKINNKELQCMTRMNRTDGKNFYLRTYDNVNIFTNTTTGVTDIQVRTNLDKMGLSVNIEDIVAEREEKKRKKEEMKKEREMLYNKALEAEKKKPISIRELIKRLLKK